MIRRIQSLRSQVVRPLLGIALGLCATFVFLTWQAPTAHAGSCTFTSSEATNSWHVAANWDCLEVPSSTTPVIIPGGQQVDIRLNASAVAGSVTIAGTLKPWGSTLSVNGDWSRTGTFTAGTSTIDFTGTAAQSINHATTFNNITVTKASGTVTAAASVTIGGTLVTSGGGAFDLNVSDLSVSGISTIGASTTVTSTTGTLTFTGAVTNAGSIGTVSGSELFSSTLANSGTLSLGAGTATSTDSLTNTGTINQELGKLALLANYTGAGTFNGQAGTTWFYGTADQSIRGVTFSNLEVRKSAGTATIVDADVTLDGKLNLDGAGTLNAGSRAFTSLHSNSIIGGTVTSTTGTLSLAGIANAGFIGSSRGDMLFPSLSFANADGVLNIGSGTATSSIAFPSDGTINGNSGTIVLMGGPSAMATWQDGATFNAQSGTVKYGKTNGAQPVNCSYTYNNLDIETVGGNATLGANCTVNGTLKVGGSSTLNAGIRNLSVAGASTILGTATSTTGTMTFTGSVTNYGNLGSSNGNMLLNGVLLENGTFDVGSGTATTTGISLGGTLNVNSGRLVLTDYFTDVGTFNLQSGTVRIAGAGDFDVTGEDFNNLEVQKTAGTATFITNDATVAGTLITAGGAGTLSAGSRALTVTGASTIGTGTTVTSTTGTLTFTGAVTGNGTGAIGSSAGNMLFSNTLTLNNTSLLSVGSGTATTTLALIGNVYGNSGTLVVMTSFNSSNFWAGSGTVIIDGATTVHDFTYHNLIIRTAGAVTVDGVTGVAVGGTLITSGTTAFNLEASTLTVTESSTIGAGTTVTSTTGTLTFTGAVTNAGSIGSVNGNKLFSSTLANTGTLVIGSGYTTTTLALTGAGTIKGDSGMLVVMDNMTGFTTFTAGSGTLRISGTGSQSIDGADFNAVNMRKSSGTATFTTTAPTIATLTTAGSGTLSSAALAMTITGTSDISPGSTVTSTLGTLTFTGAVTNAGSIGSVNGNKLFSSTLANTGTLVIGSGVTTSTGALTGSGTIKGNTGTLVASSTLAFTTFTAGTGTLRLYGSGAQNITGATFYNLDVKKSANTATIITNAATVGGNLTTEGAGTLSSAGLALTVTGTSNIGSGITVTSTSGVLTFTGAVTNAGSIGSVNGNKLFSSTLANTGTLVIGSGVATSTGALTGAGTIKGNTGTLVASSTLAFTTFTAGTGTLRLYGSGAQNITGATFYNLDVKKNGGTATIITNAPTVGGNLTTEGAGTLSSVALALTVTGASTIGSGTTVTSTSGALALAGVTNAGSLGTATGPITMTSLANTGTLTTGGASTSTGAVVNSGTIKLNSEMMNVGGNWTDTGTLTPVAGTVRFYGVNQTINEEDTFYNLKINNTGTATLGGNVTSTGTLTVYAGGKLAVGANRYRASGATYTNNGLVTIAAGGKIVHALTSSTLTDSTGAHITTNTNPGLVFVTIADADANLNGAALDTITARVTNDAASGADTELMTLVETGNATGIFRNTTFFPLVASGSIVHDNGQFEIGAGGIGSMAYTNLYDTSDTGSDTVTMTLTGTSPSGGTSTGGGGGGGGIPSTVTTYQSSASDADRPKNLANLSAQGVKIHALVKLPDDGNVNTQEDSAVYYIGADGKRHAFPNSKVFFTWYADFSGVTVVSASQMASVPLGKNVRYKPGSRMVKFLSLNDTYVVTSGGILRWVKTEDVAKTLYGTNWNTMIDDIDDTFFTNYTIGNPINVASDIDLAGVKASVNTVSDDLHL